MTSAFQDNNIPLVCDNPMQNDIFQSYRCEHIFLDGIKPGYYFMADGYQGYNLLKDGKRCCCYAHIRRYLLEAIPKGHEKDYTDPAVQGVLYCDKLFEYERRYREKGFSPEQREKQRLKDEKPVIEAFLS